jgi:serine/threonine protein kinase
MRKEEIKLLCERFTTLLGDRFSKNHREERFVPHGAAQEVFRNYKSDLQELLQHVSEALRADEGLLVSVAHRILESLSNVLAIVLMARARNDMFILDFFLSLILDGNNHVREFLILTDSELPISKARAEDLFPDRGAAFFTTQLHFCAIVLQEEKEVKYLEKEQRLCPLPYLRQELIGEGAFGQVYEVEIERHHMRSASGDGENRKPTLLARKDFRLQHAFEEELKVLRKIMRRPERHDHLVPLLAILQHDATYSLFFPLAACDLATYFDRRHDPPGSGALDENKALYHRGVALAGALAFLHRGFSDMSCYHLDLKPRNILVYNALMADEVWKITDFGLSRVRVKAQSPNDGDSTMTIGVQGTYLAPECAVAGAKVSALSDVWSFGCIFSLVLTFMVKGGKGINEFSTRRVEQPNGDLFYTNPTEPQVSPAVITWFDHLKGLASRDRCPKLMCEPLDFLLGNVLLPTRKKRLEASKIEARLKGIWTSYSPLEPLPTHNERQHGDNTPSRLSRLFSRTTQILRPTSPPPLEVGSSARGSRFSPGGEILVSFTSTKNRILKLSGALRNMDVDVQIPGSVNCVSVSDNYICNVLDGNCFKVGLLLRDQISITDGTAAVLYLFYQRGFYPQSPSKAHIFPRFGIYKDGCPIKRRCVGRLHYYPETRWDRDEMPEIPLQSGRLGTWCR